MGKNRENRGRVAAKMKRQARRQDERPESAGGGQRAALPTSDRGETDNAEGRSAEQRSPGAERTPATLRDNGDDEEGITSVPLMVGGIERMPKLRNDEGRGSYSS